MSWKYIPTGELAFDQPIAKFTIVGEVMTAPGLGHILEEFAYPRPFPTTAGTF